MLESRVRDLGERAGEVGDEPELADLEEGARDRVEEVAALDRLGGVADAGLCKTPRQNP